MSSSQVAEKALRQLVAFLKLNLEYGAIEFFGWIENKNIVVDVLTKQGSKRKALDDIVKGGIFLRLLDEKNIVRYKNGNQGGKSEKENGEKYS